MEEGHSSCENEYFLMSSLLGVFSVSCEEIIFVCVFDPVYVVSDTFG